MLPQHAGPQRNKGTASLALTERRAGKALTAAIPPPLLLSSMRNGERNHATQYVDFAGRGTGLLGAGGCGRQNAGGMGAAFFVDIFLLPAPNDTLSSRGRRTVIQGSSS